MKRTAPPVVADSAARVRRLPPLLRRAWYNLNQTFRRRIAHTGVTPDQYTVLRLLSEGPAGGLTQRQLCSLMCSDPNTMASLLSRMQSAGLISCRTHENDRRAHCVRIETEGRQKFEELRAIAVNLQEAVLSALPDGRRARFLKDLETIAAACEAQAKLDKSEQG